MQLSEHHATEVEGIGVEKHVSTPAVFISSGSLSWFIANFLNPKGCLMVILEHFSTAVFYRVDISPLFKNTHHKSKTLTLTLGNVHTSQTLYINHKLFMQFLLLQAKNLQGQHPLKTPFLLEPCVLDL